MKTVRRECCGVNLKDIIQYLLMCGRHGLCGAQDWQWLGKALER